MNPDHLAWPHQLRRRFRLIIFDWDGTAVEDRDQSVPLLIDALKRLLESGVSIAMITGTKLEHLQQQCIDQLPVRCRKNLFAFTNRGSEVWAFSESGDPVLKYRYEASRRENEALDRIADQSRKILAERGLEVRIIANRLNRRKIDLIPIPEWSDPKKSQMQELTLAIQQRLQKTGFPEGLSEVRHLVEGLASQSGLSKPRITSDQKHLEVGLTDKSDSLQWIFRTLIQAQSLNTEDVVVFGDEFGFVGGIAGSDSRMQIPELEESPFCSVGVEPCGVPEGVLYLGGGPWRFWKFLDYQLALGVTEANLFNGIILPSPNPSWLVEQEGFDPSMEHEMEALFSISNGYLGVRGSSDLPIPSSQADLYLAGIYDRKISSLPYSEIQFTAPEDRNNPYSELVSFPSPIRLSLKVGEKSLVPDSPEMLSHERILDLKKGVLFEIYYFNDQKGNLITLRSLRAASLVDPHLLLHEIEVQVEESALEVELELCPPLQGLSLRHPHLKQLPNLDHTSDVEQTSFRTGESDFGASIAIKRSLDGKPLPPGETRCRFRVDPKRPVQIREMISVFTSRDEGFAESAQAHLLEKVSDDFRECFDRELRLHASEWKRFWSKADIRFVERPDLTQAFRFNCYHLRSAAPVSTRTSVGSRGLTGRSYEGHIFWDAEIFISPFYLTLLPEAARKILMYRYHTLPGAKKRARQLGYRGACYAWESTVDGSDVTPTTITLLESKTKVPIFTGRQQIHVTADIAYAVSRYWDQTGDDDFMARYGGEILIETARFWESRVSQRDESYHILKVVGPDEYHYDVDDNAYTNWMARLNLESASACMERLPAMSGVRERLNVTPDEIHRWDEVAKRLYIPQPNADGVIEQFSGFFKLEDVTIRAQDRLHAPVDRLLHWKSVAQTKVIKQADVLMLPFLFPNAFPREIVEKNFLYYAPLTDHGSSLSPSVHAAIAARIGFTQDASRYWEESLNLDLQNLMHNTPLGIHLGCMGGTWQALVFHFLDVQSESTPITHTQRGAA